jgi:hypothetical protein
MPCIRLFQPPLSRHLAFLAAQEKPARFLMSPGGKPDFSRKIKNQLVETFCLLG